MNSLNMWVKMCPVEIWIIHKVRIIKNSRFYRNLMMMKSMYRSQAYSNDKEIDQIRNEYWKSFVFSGAISFCWLSILDFGSYCAIEKPWSKFLRIILTHVLRFVCTYAPWTWSFGICCKCICLWRDEYACHRWASAAQNFLKIAHSITEKTKQIKNTRTQRRYAHYTIVL